MREATVGTYTVAIVMAGDIEQAKQVCRWYCMTQGFCVTVEPVQYIYTGGEEAGFRIGLINYPRFPSTPEALWGHAVGLAEELRRTLCQHSFSIIGQDKTLWRSYREDA